MANVIGRFFQLSSELLAPSKCLSPDLTGETFLEIDYSELLELKSHSLYNCPRTCDWRASPVSPGIKKPSKRAQESDLKAGTGLRRVNSWATSQ